MTFLRGIEYNDSASMDGLHRLRISAPQTLFDSKLIFDDEPFFWTELLETGAGITSAHSVPRASVTLTSTLNTAGKFTRQTRNRFNYQVGKTQLILIGALINKSGGGAGSGVKRSVGYFDDDNGIFFRDNEGIGEVVLRSSTSGAPVETVVSQVDWNIDSLDGTGQSGINADLGFVQGFVIDFEWMGGGRVRLGIEESGIIHYVHEFLNYNINTVAYMGTPNLPIRVQMETTGASPASSMEIISSTVISEGGLEETGLTRATQTLPTPVDVSQLDIVYGIIGIRLKSTHLAARVGLTLISLLETAGNKSGDWFIVINPTVTNPVAFNPEDASAIETARPTGGVGGTTLAGGIVFSAGYFQSDVKGGTTGILPPASFRLGAEVDGTPDEMWLAVRSNDNATDIQATIGWQEEP